MKSWSPLPIYVAERNSHIFSFNSHTMCVHVLQSVRIAYECERELCFCVHINGYSFCGQSTNVRDQCVRNYAFKHIDCNVICVHFVLIIHVYIYTFRNLPPVSLKFQRMSFVTFSGGSSAAPTIVKSTCVSMNQRNRTLWNSHSVLALVPWPTHDATSWNPKAVFEMHD